MLLFYLINLLQVIFSPVPYSENTQCFIEIPEGAIVHTNVSCIGPLTGSIYLDPDYISGGTEPYYYDWNNLATPGNDIYFDDGEPLIDSLGAGMYSLTVIDAGGCKKRDTVIIQPPVEFVLTTLIDSIGICDIDGGISILSVQSDPGIRIYNWDLASTIVDDDFGSGQYDLGIPPAENDAEDQPSGLLKGVYYLTVTIIADTLVEGGTCTYRDTFIIYDPYTVTYCPAEDITLLAGEDDPAFSYQWQIDSTGSFENLSTGPHFANVNQPVLMIDNTPSSWYNYDLRCIVTKPLEMDTSEVQTLIFRNCWRTGTFWNNGNNWECQSVPDEYTDAYMLIINSGQSFVSSDAVCRSLRLFPGFELVVFPDKILHVTGRHEE